MKDKKINRENTVRAFLALKDKKEVRKETIAELTSMVYTLVEASEKPSIDDIESCILVASQNLEDRLEVDYSGVDYASIIRSLMDVVLEEYGDHLDVLLTQESLKGEQ